MERGEDEGWVDGLMRQALRCGISVFEFWDLTPRETYQVIEATIWRDRRQQKLDTTLAWRVAQLMRLKRLPSLKSLLADAGPAKPLKGKELQKRRAEFAEMSEAAHRQMGALAGKLAALTKKNKGRKKRTPLSTTVENGE